MGKDFHFATSQIIYEGHPVCNVVVYSSVNRPVPEADQSSPPSAKIKNT